MEWPSHLYQEILRHGSHVWRWCPAKKGGGEGDGKETEKKQQGQGVQNREQLTTRLAFVEGDQGHFVMETEGIERHEGLGHE